jgi:SAM-dependent methyltransferase
MSSSISLDLTRHWGTIDQTSNPRDFVDYLDAVSTLDVIQRIKQRTHELLRLADGHRVLDVGCGVGEDVQSMARRVGSAGRAVGIDSSMTMIAEAKERLKPTGLAAEFRAGNASHLEFASDSFDGCRAERVFVHLCNPKLALAEMVRVTRPGGRVVVFDVDWETLIIDVPDLALTRKMLNFNGGRAGSRWIGRQLRGLFLDAGLTDVEVLADTLMFTDFAQADSILKLREVAEHARAALAVPDTDADRWLAGLEQSDQAGRFFAAVTGFCVGGIKPPKGGADDRDDSRGHAAGCRSHPGDLCTDHQDNADLVRSRAAVAGGDGRAHRRDTAALSLVDR